MRDNRVKYLVSLIIYEYNILRKYKNNNYTQYIKEETIKCVLINNSTFKTQFKQNSTFFDSFVV